MSPWALNRLVQALSKGAVIGYPTDTIWGFGCDPFAPESVARILQIKQRPVEKGLILLSSRLEYCEPLIRLEPQQREQIKLPAERPTTWLVAASDGCPPWIRGNHPTVAIRITDHPLVAYLCSGMQSPLVSTSANAAGKSTARSALQLRRQFGDQLDTIVTGFSTGGGQASQIKSLATGNLLRTAN
jgi:L-threonylcarbamoyladenylate synthase